MMDKLLGILSAITLLFAIALSVLGAMVAGVAVVALCYMVAFVFGLI